MRKRRSRNANRSCRRRPASEAHRLGVSLTTRPVSGAGVRKAPRLARHLRLTTIGPPRTHRRLAKPPFLSRLWRTRELRVIDGSLPTHTGPTRTHRHLAKPPTRLPGVCAARFPQQRRSEVSAWRARRRHYPHGRRMYQTAAAGRPREAISESQGSVGGGRRLCLLPHPAQPPTLIRRLPVSGEMV